MTDWLLKIRKLTYFDPEKDGQLAINGNDDLEYRGMFSHQDRYRLVFEK